MCGIYVAVGCSFRIVSAPRVRDILANASVDMIGRACSFWDPVPCLADLGSPSEGVVLVCVGVATRGGGVSRAR